MKKINYGNWRRGQQNFKGDFSLFKNFLYKKDMTMARIVLRDFGKKVKALQSVLIKMEREYQQIKKLKGGEK